MKLCSTVAGLIALFSLGAAAPTWPSAIDELEDVMFLNTGYKSRGFAAHVTPCSFSEFGVGRQTAAEWLRIGFHDMSTTNTFFEPFGGIDGSIAFELDTGENLGPGFVSTLQTYAGLYNSRLSLSDMIALGVYASVRACGGPVVPIRGGRIDATAAGPQGVPQPQNAIGTFKSQFQRMGFNTVDMIQMTACGHTMGGVHASFFPEIVPAGTAPNDYQLFDNTPEFDNSIATRYLSGPDTDPLSVGISVKNTRNADFVVFNADKNVTIQAMATAAAFSSVCSNILQRMIDTVAPTIALSAPITPYEVKPSGLQLTLLAGGAQITFAGDIRVRTSTRSASQIASVRVIYKDRTGAAGSTISTTLSGAATGFDDSFTFYGFSSNIPATSSISSFTVVITGTGGATTTYDNNGVGFPIQDSVIALAPQSCVSGTNLTVVAAVRNTVTSPVSLGVTQKVARTGGVPVPALVNATIVMIQGATAGPYSIYSGSSTIGGTTGTKYGVSSGVFADDFKDAASLGATCAAFGSSAPSSTSSSVVSTSVSQTSSSSAVVTTSAVPTPVHKPVVGAYSFLGCYTEGTGVRALAGAAFVDYANMTSEICAANCAAYVYWGIEYGGECYCGNILDVTSTLAPLSDCSFICPGNGGELCGAGNRLELYELTSIATASKSSSSIKSTSSLPSSTQSSIAPTSSLSSTTSSTPTSTPTPAIKSRIGAYSFLGCYTEGLNVRALAGPSFYDYVGMTLEICASNCAPMTYFGVEYGGECYCGDVLAPSSNLTASAECGFVCPGDGSEFCGAGNRLEMYKLGAATSSSSVLATSSSSSVVSISSSSSVAPTSSVSSVVSTSSLPSSSTAISSSSVRPSSSTAVSSSSVRPSSSSVLPSSSRLSSSSSKLSTVTSSSKLSTSTLKSTSSSKSSSKSSLSSTKSSSTLKTSSSTKLSSTSAKSSSSSKVSTLSTLSTSKLTTSSQPLSTSSASSTKPPSSSSSLISSTSSLLPSTTSSSAPTASPTLHIVPSAGAYNYLGCFTEGTNVRALGSASFPNDTNTIEACVAACSPYKYAGAEYGRECWCSDSFGTGAVLAPDSDCSMTCAGSPYEYCGAGNRLSVYIRNGTGTA